MLREDLERTHVQAGGKRSSPSTSPPTSRWSRRPDARRRRRKRPSSPSRGARLRGPGGAHFAESRENVVYAPDAPVPQSQLQQGVDEALNFAESMGFILESNWAGLTRGRRKRS